MDARLIHACERLFILDVEIRRLADPCSAPRSHILKVRETQQRLSGLQKTLSSLFSIRKLPILFWRPIPKTIIGPMGRSFEDSPIQAGKYFICHVPTCPTQLLCPHLLKRSKDRTTLRLRSSGPVVLAWCHF